MSQTYIGTRKEPWRHCLPLVPETDSASNSPKWDGGIRPWAPPEPPAGGLVSLTWGPKTVPFLIHGPQTQHNSTIFQLPIYLQVAYLWLCIIHLSPSIATVDGRNPAPPWMVETCWNPINNGMFAIYQLVISQASTVSSLGFFFVTMYYSSITIYNHLWPKKTHNAVAPSAACSPAASAHRRRLRRAAAARAHRRKALEGRCLRLVEDWLDGLSNQNGYGIVISEYKDIYIYMCVWICASVYMICIYIYIRTYTRK